MNTLHLLLYFCACSIETQENPLAIDDDGDGFSEFDGDCDDRDAGVYPGSVTEDVYKQCMLDRDGDGFGDANAPEPYASGTDCDDDNPYTFPGAAEKESNTECLTDEDEDGWSAEVADCDDSDPSTVDDMDCDGVLTLDDCDDSDPSLLDTMNDQDCDGVLTLDDCDDNDDSILSQSGDMDCDGVLTIDDCDDSDPSTVDDMDCDGTLSADDCDDFNPYSTVESQDADCDGILSTDDCDDNDDSAGAQSVDMDCDGVLTADDCDDLDPNSTIVNQDMDCDGVLTADDCDDTDFSSTARSEDMDCDGVLTINDCDDADYAEQNICFHLSLGGGQTIDLSMVAAGTFLMGSPDSEVGRGTNFVETQHQVTLTNDYFVMTTEVTQGMFAQVMGYDSYQGESTTGDGGSYGVGTDYPAYYVDWNMAADFSNAITAIHNSVMGTALQDCYNCSGSGITVSCTLAMNPYMCNGYRLPTEAEWEYAARSGATAAYWTPNGGGDIPSGSTIGCSGNWTLSDGTNLGDLGWYCGNEYTYGSKSVGQLQANDFGLYDMVGNVWEWVEDGYSVYSTNSITDPYTSHSVGRRVIRGGSWGSYSQYTRSAARNLNYFDSRYSYVGFRLVRKD